MESPAYLRRWRISTSGADGNPGAGLHSVSGRRSPPIFKLYLGSSLAVVVTSPEATREIFREKDEIFANHYMPVTGHVASLGGNDIVAAPYGDQWRKLRKIFVREMLSRSNLDALSRFRREAIRSSVGRVYEGCCGGAPAISVRNLAFETVVNAMMGMLWGGSSVAETIGAAEFSDLTTELMVMIGKPNVSDVFPALARFDLQGIERDTRKIVGVFEAMCDSVIDQRRRSTEASIGESTRDFLQFLLESHENKESSESITMSQIKALLIDIVVGGTDTTSATVEWGMAELLANPGALTKVMEELNRVVGLNASVEECHLSGLTYLKAALKETLRLHPPFPLLVPRCPNRSTTLGGYFVPKDTKIFVNAWAIQRDLSLWENPTKFRPERFLKATVVNDDISGNCFRFTPFGSGRRVCAGVPLAERMLSYVVASLLQSFHWTLPPNATLDMSDVFGVVVKKRTPLILIPSPRLSNSNLYAS